MGLDSRLTLSDQAPGPEGHSMRTQKLGTSLTLGYYRPARGCALRELPRQHGRSENFRASAQERASGIRSPSSVVRSA